MIYTALPSELKKNAMIEWGRFLKEQDKLWKNNVDF